MHPGFHGWWSARHSFARAHEGERAGCGHPREHGLGGFGRGGFERGGPGFVAGPSFDEGGVLGVRRPLRFLAYKLVLNEEQVSLLAAVLDDLKTERAQAAVDQRRRVSALAETIELSDFDEARLTSIGAEQQRSEERIRAAVATALKKLHAALDAEQRKKLAYLLRTGALAI